MAERITLQIKSSIEAITPANDDATRWLEEHDVPASAVFLVNLAIEELVTNCVKYGYSDSAEHIIEVVLTLGDGRLTTTVSDDGRAFNPLAAPTPDTSLALEERPIGGLGLHLLRKMSDEMSYERRDNRNHVTLAKQL